MVRRCLVITNSPSSTLNSRRKRTCVRPARRIAAHSAGAASRIAVFSAITQTVTLTTRSRLGNRSAKEGSGERLGYASHAKSDRSRRTGRSVVCAPSQLRCAASRICEWRSTFYRSCLHTSIRHMTSYRRRRETRCDHRRAEHLSPHFHLQTPCSAFIRRSSSSVRMTIDLSRAANLNVLYGTIEPLRVLRSIFILTEGS